MTSDMKRFAQTDLYRGLAYLTDGFLQTSQTFPPTTCWPKTNRAGPKEGQWTTSRIKPTPALTRRTLLCLGAGGAAVMLGPGRVEVRRIAAHRTPAGRTGTKSASSPPASVARSATGSARATSSRPPHLERRRAEHAHANVRLLCQLGATGAPTSTAAPALCVSACPTEALKLPTGPQPRTPSSARRSSTPTGAWHIS